MSFAWPCFLWICKHKFRLYRTTGQSRHLTWVDGTAPVPSSSGAMGSSEVVAGVTEINLALLVLF